MCADTSQSKYRNLRGLTTNPAESILLDPPDEKRVLHEETAVRVPLNNLER